MLYGDKQCERRMRKKGESVCSSLSARAARLTVTRFLLPSRLNPKENDARKRKRDVSTEQPGASEAFSLTGGQSRMVSSPFFRLSLSSNVSRFSFKLGLSDDATLMNARQAGKRAKDTSAPASCALIDGSFSLSRHSETLFFLYLLTCVIIPMAAGASGHRGQTPRQLSNVSRCNVYSGALIRASRAGP